MLESDGKELAEGGVVLEACWQCFHLELSPKLPKCVCATAMTNILKMTHELISMQSSVSGHILSA